ncbi:ATP-dependent zinc metalloprotease FtsH [Imhoffiella purpurea]|uniref:ATP-dependent zinc metalloprotease FtsH n=1 Tax=Imhoffiella purpurea TaxID=1249627 RepID=W9V7K2_9GAMM|nr:ATP-dependent zinc metalloprotease FtsH [Imhoffiella purpurea]EXJ15384.1 Cell division protein FtsH [Imhoffiella purpurea]
MPTPFWTTPESWPIWILGLTAFGSVAVLRLHPLRRSGSKQAPPPGGGPTTSPGREPPPAAAAFWWITLALLLAWNTLPFLFDGTPKVAKIPYSSFIEQVQQNNVAQVGIQGSEIAGELKTAKDWDPASGALSKAPSGDDRPQKSRADTSGTSSQPDSSSAHASAQTLEVTRFTTVFPSSVGDPQLMSTLERHGVAVAAAPQSEHYMARILGSLLPTALLVGFFWWMGRRAMQQQQSIFGAGKSQARRFVREEAPAVTFADVAGVDAAKGQLQEIVSILKSPERYRALGARTPRGVLLAGPPGTGKTLLARAVAGEAQVPFFSISGSEFVEMFVGVGASRVRNLFQEVKAAAPAILFVDELDAVGRRRGAGVGMVNDEREQTLNQLLVEMDGFDARTSVIVLAATNRPDVLDPALRRPGRFDREVILGLPDRNGRRAIIGIHTRALELADDVDPDALASITMGMSGAQLANLCNEAALVAARDAHARIQAQDFETALDRVLLGEALPLTLDADARRTVAYHESGHALVAWLTPEADPVHKVTIVPHGMALGVTEQRPEDDRYNLSRHYLMARLRVMLGGRGAEETVFEDVTTGAENDLVQATRQARHMVATWGMSELGLAAYESSGEDRFLGYELGQGRPYSEETARRIDAEVNRLLAESHAAVLSLLSSARDRLDALAQALLERETVGEEELVRILGPRPAR